MKYRIVKNGLNKYYIEYYGPRLYSGILNRDDWWHVTTCDSEKDLYMTKYLLAMQLIFYQT